MDNNNIHAFNDKNYDQDLTNGYFLTQIDPTNYAHYCHNVQDVQTNYQLHNEKQGTMMNSSPFSYSQLLTQGLSPNDDSGLPLHSNSMPPISSDNVSSINYASALPFWHGLYHHNGQNLSNYQLLDTNHINSPDNLTVPMDIQSKYNLAPFPNDYHYGSEISPKFTSVNAFINEPMINPGEFGNGYNNSSHCSSTFTSELDPILNQQIGKLAKPDNWVQNGAHHLMLNADQYNPIRSTNSFPDKSINIVTKILMPNDDNSDEDILGKMDSIIFSHTRLLTEGVLSTDDHVSLPWDSIN